MRVALAGVAVTVSRIPPVSRPTTTDAVMVSAATTR
jgi:hypothetical protein